MKFDAWIEQSGLPRPAVMRLLGARPEQMAARIEGTYWPRRKMLIRIHRLTQGQVTPNDFFVDDGKADSYRGPAAGELAETVAVERARRRAIAAARTRTAANKAARAANRAARRVAADAGLNQAIAAAGTQTALAQHLGVTRAAVSLWRRVPHYHVVAVEQFTGISREILRPDLYPPRPPLIVRPTRRLITRPAA